MKMQKTPGLIVVLYTAAVMCSLALTNKIIDFHGYLISGCLIVFPLLYTFGDIIAELFGFKEAKALLWQVLLAGLLFSITTSLAISMKSPNFYDNAREFRVVFGMDFRFMVAAIIAVWVGGYINAYIISRWKAFVVGKYFWIRSISSTVVGETVNSALAFPIAFAGVFPVDKIVNLTLVSLLIKLVYAIIFVVPASMVVNYYKKTKLVDVYSFPFPATSPP